MARDETRDQTLLDQYWNARNGDGDTPDDLDEPVRRAVDRFHAADDAPAPDPEFVDSLWSELADVAPAAATRGGERGWTEGPDDEPSNPQFVAERQGNRLSERQQSTWRRRARQIGEMVAAAVVLVLITGGLILAYQNLIGEGDGEGGPASGDDAGGVPSLTPIEGVERWGDILGGASLESALIERYDGQDYAFLLTFSESEDGEAGNPALQTLRLDASGEHEVVGSQELEMTLTPDAGYEMGRMALEGNVLYAPIPDTEQPGVWAIDVSDPTGPEDIGFLDTLDHRPRTIAASNGVAVATGTVGNVLSFIDISDPGHPVLVDQYETGESDRYIAGTTPPLAIADETLYVAHPHGLSIIDVSNPTEAMELGFYENPGWSEGDDPRSAGETFDNIFLPHAYHDVALVDERAYIAAADQGVTVLDVSDPSAPRETGHVARDDRTYRLALLDRHVGVLGVAEDEQGEQGPAWTWSIDAVDVSDADTSRIVSQIGDIAVEHEDEALTSLALMWETRQFVAGRSFVLAYGTGGAYVAHIDWVEPSDESPDPAPTPTAMPEPESESVPPPDQIEDFEPEQVIELDQTMEFDYGYLSLMTLELAPDATAVNVEYQIENAIAMGSMVSLRLPDGSHHPGSSAGGAAQPEGELREETLFFPPVPNGTESIDLVFPGFLASENEPIETTFPVPERLAGEDDPGQSGRIEEPVGHTFEVDGQTLEVDHMALTIEDDAPRVEVFVRNTASEETSEAEAANRTGDELIMFQGSDWGADAVSLVDDTGQEYTHQGGGYQLDGTSLGFVGPINPDATELTMRAEQRGRLVYPFEPVEITLEDADSDSGESEEADQPAIEEGDLTVYFPRQPEGDHEYDDGGPLGRLALDDQGCLRVGDDDGPLIIWPYSGYTVGLVDGEVALIDEESGDVIANVGEEVRFHGSDPEFPLPEVPDHMLLDPLPDACTGDEGYFVTGPGTGGQ